VKFIKDFSTRICGVVPLKTQQTPGIPLLLLYQIRSSVVLCGFVVCQKRCWYSIRLYCPPLLLMVLVLYPGGPFSCRSLSY